MKFRNIFIRLVLSVCGMICLIVLAAHAHAHAHFNSIVGNSDSSQSPSSIPKKQVAAQAVFSGGIDAFGFALNPMGL